MEKWIGKIAVVTGASSGIGASIFSDLARHGLTVIGIARDVTKIDELVMASATENPNLHSYRCDISDMESVRRAFLWLEERFGFIHILINNAGVGKKIRILEQGDQHMENIVAMMNTNVLGMIDCTRRAYKLMKKSNDFCYIVNMNSVLGHSIPFSNQGTSIYIPTKHAVTALTEVIRQELIESGDEMIRISSISPGYVRTNFQKSAGFPATFEDMPYLNPQDIAYTVQFLLKTPYNVNITDMKVKPVGEKF